MHARDTAHATAMFTGWGRKIRPEKRRIMIIGRTRSPRPAPGRDEVIFGAGNLPRLSLKEVTSGLPSGWHLRRRHVAHWRVDFRELTLTNLYCVLR